MNPATTILAGGLLVGGSSCVGKTTACRVLAARHGFAHVETDRTLPADAGLRPLDGSDSVWDHDAQELCQRLVRAAEAGMPYIESQARELSIAMGPWVLEGERVHPALARRLTDARVARGVFVVELDGARIFRTLIERLPGFKTLSVQQQATVAEVDRLYNEWLVEESRHYDIACIESQPWHSLAERLLDQRRYPVALPN